MPHHHERGWPEEDRLMREVNRIAGDQLEALAQMRNTTVKEVGVAKIPTDLPGPHMALILILTTAISGVDAVRILLEHGYSEQAHGLTRTLYEAEVDVALLAAKPEWAEYYAAYEAYELARLPGKAIKEGLITIADDQQGLVDRRKQDLAGILERMGHELPENWATLDLFEASAAYAKKVWGRPLPITWRPASWKAVLEAIPQRQARALHPEHTEEELAEWMSVRRQEHYVAYSEMSARLHGSPRVAAERWPNFQAGGFPEGVSRVAEIAATHFLRLHHVVFHELGVEFDREHWTEMYRRAREAS